MSILLGQARMCRHGFADEDDIAADADDLEATTTEVAQDGRDRQGGPPPR